MSWKFVLLIFGIHQKLKSEKLNKNLSRGQGVSIYCTSELTRFNFVIRNKVYFDYNTIAGAYKPTFSCNWNGSRFHLGPWLFWSPRSFGSKEFEPCMKRPYNVFHVGHKFLGDQKSQGPKWDIGPFQLQPNFCSTLKGTKVTHRMQV